MKVHEIREHFLGNKDKEVGEMRKFVLLGEYFMEEWMQNGGDILAMVETEDKLWTGSILELRFRV